MMGGFNHGFSLYAKDCPKRRISVDGWPKDSALRAALWEHSAEQGVMHVEVSGRITTDHELAITDVHKFSFEPMSDNQMAVWWGRTR